MTRTRRLVGTIAALIGVLQRERQDVFRDGAGAVVQPVPARVQAGRPDPLDEFQAYERGSGRASLRITISKAFVDAIDANHALLPSECPRRDCRLIRGIVRFHARAYAPSAGGDFFNVVGVAFVEGHEGRWSIDAATTSDSRRALWDAGYTANGFTTEFALLRINP
jgi:hypothetical protein